MSNKSNNRPLTVGLVAVPQTSAAVLFGLHEVFAAVGVVWELITGSAVSARKMTPQVIAQNLKTLRSPLGVAMKADLTFANSGDADIVVVPDFDLTNFHRIRWDEPVRYLQKQYDKGAVICSVCTGSVLLAEAGLLEGLEATTHWFAESVFRSRYPNVKLRPERILTVAGKDHRIVTGGGASSWNELALYLIARFSGVEEARRITKIFLLGESQRRATPVREVSDANTARRRRYCQESVLDIEELRISEPGRGNDCSIRTAFTNVRATLQERNGIHTHRVRADVKSGGGETVARNHG